MKERSRILLSDDHVIVMEGLVRLLESEFEVVGRVADGRSAVDEAIRLDPDALVMDISMPGLNGIDALRRIRAERPCMSAVILSQQAGAGYLEAAFQSGAGAYVLKNEAASELLTALHEVLAGRYYISAQLRGLLRKPEWNPYQNPAGLFALELTARQREVLKLVAEGRTAREIADLLDISVKTVEFHKAGIMEELHLRSTAELTRYALDHGILRQ